MSQNLSSAAIVIGALRAKLVLEKSVLRLIEHLNMTIAVDWDVKTQTKQANTHIHTQSSSFLIGFFQIYLIHCYFILQFENVNLYFVYCVTLK